MNYLDELNESQKQAVLATEGPVMIVAGAGSGKTRVLTYRVAHLMQKGVDAFNILSLTFTNKAAKAMKERITKIVGGAESRNLWMGTFHSVFARILRAEAEKIGYPTNFTIYDTEDSKGLIKDILKELNLDEKVYKPGLVYNRISAAKNNLISATSYRNNTQAQEEDKSSGKPLIGNIYERYAKRCFKASAMDFDDLLFNTNVLLRDFPEVLLKYQERFKYILVDEYQDTNFSQYVIIKQLAARYENICVVGDDAQSIYAFRGANIQNILNFEKDYPDLKTFKLEQNYRSTKNIVNAANSVIANNKEQLQKLVWTENDSGDRIKLMRALTDNEEGYLVANSIFEIKMQNQTHNKSFAILYRTNAQSRAMEEALRRLNIPYKIYGGLSFYQRKEIKDILAYCRLSINNHDEESLKRIINYPARGIGDTTIQKIMLAATDHDVSIWTILDNINDFTLEINSGTKSKLDAFITLIKNFSAAAITKGAYEVGEYIANASGILKEFYTDRTPEGVSRYENIQELLNGMKEFSEEEEPEVGSQENEVASEKNEVESEELEERSAKLEERSQETEAGSATLEARSQELEVGSENQEPRTKNQEPRTKKQLAEFMQDIALLTDADKEEDDTEKDRVSLMTIHAAKGLEFPYVFVVGMEENLFPSQLSLNSRSDLEEERRLFYVALTRAEKKITLSFSLTRYRWGNLINCEPSRFIEEIEQKYLEAPSAPQHDQERTTQRDPGFTKFKSKQPQANNPAHPILKKNLVKVSTARNTNFDPESLKDLQVGMQVEHEKFGTGQVTNMEGIYPNNKATVVFDKAGQKQLLLKFARLKILN